MQKMLGIIKEREEYLLDSIQKLEKDLINAPEGNIRICNRQGKPQFYYRNDAKDFSGTYMREEDYELVQKIAQKSYAKKALSSAKRELLAIEKYKSYYPKENLEEVYEKLHAERKKLVVPIEITEEEYRQNWESVTYIGKEIEESVPKIYTEKGDLVRSKSEMIIADSLRRAGIPYRYEYPVYTKEWGYIYPDFTVLNKRSRKEWIWEHFGKMDDPLYVERNMQKINIYERNGIVLGKNLLITFESKQQPLSQQVVNRMIEEFFGCN